MTLHLERAARGRPGSDATKAQLAAIAELERTATKDTANAGSLQVAGPVDCEEGVAYKVASNSSACTPCSGVECALGELYVPCTRRANAGCVACAAAPAKAEFMTAGSCLTRCKAGYYADATRAGQCVACLPPTLDNLRVCDQS